MHDRIAEPPPERRGIDRVAVDIVEATSRRNRNADVAQAKAFGLERPSGRQFQIALAEPPVFARSACPLDADFRLFVQQRDHGAPRSRPQQDGATSLHRAQVPLWFFAWGCFSFFWRGSGA